jgi:hypothetical protein
LHFIPNFKEIPDFSASQYENLISSLLNGACIFFGAGISKFAGYKLWDELRNALVDYFWEKKDTLPSRYLRNQNFDHSMCENLKKCDSIIEAFDYLYRINKNLFISGIKDIFKIDSKKNNNEIYQFLKKLDNGKNIFITTNIDKGFQTYLGLTDGEISICPEFTNPPKLITYLHGRIDKEDTWIFTRGQYNKGYEGKAPCMNYIKNIFKNRSVLFIGYGLREDEIKRAIFSTEKLKTHYWLQGCTRNNIDSLKIHSTSLKENYNIHLIPYDIDNGERSELICEVIDSLYKKVTEKERNIK